MAKKFLTPIDMSNLEVQNLKLHQAAPTPLVEGLIWYDVTTDHRPKVRGAATTTYTVPFMATTPAAGGALTVGLTGGPGADLLTAAPALHTHTMPSTATAGVDGFMSGTDKTKLDGATSTAANSALLVIRDAFGNYRTVTPIDDADVANKGYVDGVASGLDIKGSCRAATTVGLPPYTRTGLVITASSPGAIGTVGGVALAATNRLLLKNGAAGSDNGLYVVTTVGDGGTAFVLTRTADADGSPANEVSSGLYTYIEEGTLAGTGWVLSTPNPITLGVTSLTFTQFCGSNLYTAGTGINIGSNVISLASGVITTPGTYTSLTIDTYGRATAGADIVTTNGFVARTGAGTFAARTITGTAARITVTGGDGSSTPTIDIAATYVGQSSITTLGSITTGAWTSSTAVAIAYGGTGQTSASGAFNALSPMTTLGDIIYGGAAGVGTRLGGNTSTTKRFLGSTGNGSISAAPVWELLVASDIPVLDASKITTGTLPVPRGGTGAGTFTADAVLLGNGTSAIKVSDNISFPSNVLTLGSTGGSAAIGAIQLKGSSSGSTTLQVAAVAGGTFTLTMPITAPQNGYVLSTDATGQLAWAAAGASVIRASGTFGAITANTPIAVTTTVTAAAPIVQVYSVATGALVECDIVITSSTVVTFTFAVAASSGDYRWVLLA